jgi:hypothetical protein
MPALKNADAPPALHYDTLKDSRDHLSDVLDAAQEGLMVRLRRGRSRRDERAGSVSVIKTAVLQELLEKLVADSIESVYNDEDALYTVAVRGLPLAAEGEILTDAVDDLIDGIREYCDRWVTRLRFAPNHEGNVPLVYLAQSLSDDELHSWLMNRAGA